MNSLTIIIPLAIAALVMGIGWRLSREPDGQSSRMNEDWQRQIALDAALAEIHRTAARTWNESEGATR